MSKTKFDYEIEDFEKAFRDKKDKRIVLYGTGRITATLLDRQKEFNIIGICDRDKDKIGTQIFGVRVVDQEFVEKNADLLIINTSESYWQTIYQRIKKWKIPIYFRNGELAVEHTLVDQNADYWSLSADSLIETIEDYEVVSFDVFDTLLMRKVIAISDVYKLVEKNLDKQFDTQSDYVQYRKKAAAERDNPTFNEIYDALARITRWDQEKVQAAKEYEWNIEQCLLVPRTQIVNIYNSIRNKKEVYFVSDMYFSSEQIQSLLRLNGIEISLERILVSCELGRTKAEGKLWEYYQSEIVKNRKALHVGDDKTADIKKAEKYGIQGFLIRSSLEMLRHSPIDEVLPYVETLYSSLAIGNICAKICNDPFALNPTKGVINFENLETGGYCIWGNLLYCFFEWLKNKAEEDGLHKLLFFAREGYLLVPLFERYMGNCDKSADLSAEYLEISRRAAMVAGIEDKKDIYEVVEFPYDGTLRGFFQERFQIQISELEQGEQLFRVVDKNLLYEMIDKYYENILCEAKREKRNYLQYLEQMDLHIDFAVVDSQLYGSTQYYLSKICKKEITGYYMCACMDESNRFRSFNPMSGCFTGLTGKDGKDSSILRYAPFTESFFTAPNGMFLYVDDDGKKVYSENKNNQKFYDVREAMSEGIGEFIDDMVDISSKFDLHPGAMDARVADFLFETFMNGGFIPNDIMRKSFYYDNAIAGNKEVPLWE